MKRVIAAAVLAAMAGAPGLRAQTADVPPGHWAYNAVQELAAKGLILGYPDGKFLGNRSLTRYEMATLIKRVLDNLDKRISASKTSSGGSAQRLDDIDRRVATLEGRQPAVTQEELDDVRKLVDEYKVELTVIGTDMQKTQAELSSLQSDVADLKTASKAHDASIKKIGKATDTLASAYKHSHLTGYMQVRYQGSDAARPGRTGQYNQDQFFVRRAKFVGTGEVTPGIGWTLEVDVSHLAGVAANPLDTFTDGFLNFTHVVPQGVLRFGQFRVPFGYNNVQSPSNIFTLDRPQVIDQLFPRERDQGLALLGKLGSSPFFYTLGVLNGAGQNPITAPGTGNEGGENILPNSSYRTVIGRLEYRSNESADDYNGGNGISKGFAAGVSYMAGRAYTPGHGAVGGAAIPAYSSNRVRLGYDAAAAFGPFSVAGEYVTAIDPANDYQGPVLPTGFALPGAVAGLAFPKNIHEDGYYVQALYQINKNWGVYGQNDFFNPLKEVPDTANPYSVSRHVNSVGLIRNFGPAAKATLQYDFRSPILGLAKAGAPGSGTGPSADAFTLQFQVKY